SSGTVAVLQATEDSVTVLHSPGPAHVAVDPETVYVPGKVDPFTAQLRVISIATEDDAGRDIAYVFDVKDMDRRALGRAFNKRAEDLGQRRLEVLGFNANFDDPVTSLALRSEEHTSELQS